jgi:hypothetical protein
MICLCFDQWTLILKFTQTLTAMNWTQIIKDPIQGIPHFGQREHVGLVSD